MTKGPEHDSARWDPIFGTRTCSDKKLGLCAGLGFRHRYELMDEALAVRTQKEPTLQGRRNKYGLGLSRDQKFQVYVAIRTLWRLADVPAQIEQHGGVPDPIRILSRC